MSSESSSKAFVMINVDTGTETEVMKELRNIQGVTEVHFVFGVYDIVVKVEAGSQSMVKEIITSKIRRLDKVRSTLTMMVVS